MDLNIDNPEVTEGRVKLIRKKKILNSIYCDYYEIFAEEITSIPKGKVVELGSGGGFLKEKIPQVITSDIMKLSSCDMCFPAEKMPFRSKTLSAILMLNVFHHVKNPKAALEEFNRCLKKGGIVVMIEPYNSIFSNIIYTHFHHEYFNPQAKNWKITGDGPLSDANGAIPWIIFSRDKKKYNKLFPSLQIKKFTPHTPIRYILSGGLSRKQLIPDFLERSSIGIEKLVSPLNARIGMFVTIVLQKN